MPRLRGVMVNNLHGKQQLYERCLMLNTRMFNRHEFNSC